MQGKSAEDEWRNGNIEKYQTLASVKEIEKIQNVDEKAKKIILEGRKNFINVLTDVDPRFVIITGPCSIHDPESTMEYAEKLKKLSSKVEDKILLLMRTYFEKPRTVLGWKGLVNDPHLDDSFHVEEGLKTARSLLVRLAQMGVYTATELLDPITAVYLAPLVAWAAIGARTTESQIHREMVSGLSAPVGFKNTTNGDLHAAFNAIKSSSAPHCFLGANDEGKISVVYTKGNKHSHLVLRGGNQKPNYSQEDIKKAEKILKEYQLPLKIMVDCSHDNSGKNHERQAAVAHDVLEQKKKSNQSIFAIMLESHLKAGNQKINKDREKMDYGVSITDKCIGWEETEEIILQAHKTFSSL